MSCIGLDFFLDNPELKQRHENGLPNNEMYRFFPPQEEIILTDSNPEKNYRFIFNGQPKTDFEKKKLLKFQEHESKNGKLNYPPDWLESDTMRMLQASEYDMKKTYKSIKENIEFLNGLPNSINNNIISILNSGFLYVYGRDHHFRPIIVVSIKTISNLISKKVYQYEDINQSIIYLLRYILKYNFIPGQIENWVIIVDFKDVGLSDVSDFKKVFGTLSRYRGRVFRNYFVNITGFLKIAVKTALKIFGSSTTKKLKILGTDELHKMQDIISKDNIQQKYGGTAPDIIPGGNNLFPPVFPSKNYAINGEQLNIISEEAYKEMCLNSNPYKPFVISPKYQELWKQENEKESTKPSVEPPEIEKKVKIIEEKTVREQTIIKEKKKKENQKNNNLLIKNQYSKKNNRDNIVCFLKEFDEIHKIEHLEEKKYHTKTPITIQEISIFFKRLQTRKIKKFL